MSALPFPAPRGAVTDDDRRFWFERFSDEGLAEMARALGGYGSVETVRRWRERLLTRALTPA